MPDEKKPVPTINVRFLFNYCNDIEAVRRFYTELLGMKQGSFKNEKEWGWVVYQCQGLEVMFFRTSEKLPVSEGFACQPGWAGGTRVASSWGIEVPEDQFTATYDRLKAAEVRMFK